MVGGKIPVQGGACEESVSVSVCYVVFSLLLECYHDNDKVSYITCLTSNINNWLITEELSISEPFPSFVAEDQKKACVSTAPCWQISIRVPTGTANL